MLLFLLQQGQLQGVVLFAGDLQLLLQLTIGGAQLLVLLQQFADQLFQLFEGGVEHDRLRSR
ncbi:hypothetical protein D3C81_1899870 [compost metagenome]